MNLDARKVTLPDVAAPATAAAGPITCTYTNTYTPKATLTLVKAVDGGTALPAQWTLSAGWSHADLRPVRLSGRDEPRG